MSDTTLLIEDHNQRSPKYVLAALSAWIGSFAAGTVLGYSAPAITSLDTNGSHIHLDDHQKSLFASLMPFGAVVGCVCAGLFNESFGRKGTLIFTTVPFISGWILIAYSGNLDSIFTLFIGRFFTGLCCGLISLTAPVYIGETSDPSKRGFFGSGFQLTITLGIVVTYLLGKYLNWADLALLMTAFPLLLLLTIICMPESPAWLLKKGRISEATEANIFLHGAEGSRSHAVDVSTAAMQNQNEEYETNGLPFFQQFTLFRQPQYYKPLLIAMALMFFQQFSGINPIIFFMTSIFINSHFTTITPADSTIIVGFIQVLATLVSCFLVDRCGRKILLVVSSVGTCLSLIPMIVYYFIEQFNPNGDFHIVYGWIPIVSIIMFVVTFSLGLGPIPWLTMGELLPFRLKNISSIIVSSFNWFCAFIIITFFYHLISVINMSGIYLLFCIICALCTVFTLVFLPETKGKSFQEIETLFAPPIPSQT